MSVSWAFKSIVLPRLHRPSPGGWHSLSVTGRLRLLQCPSILSTLLYNYNPGGKPTGNPPSSAEGTHIIASKETVANSHTEVSHLKTMTAAAAAAGHLCIQNIGRASSLLSDGILHI